MKKLINLLIATVAIIALSGCGDEDSEVNGGSSSVSIAELSNGYHISGVNSSKETIGLDYCPDNFFSYYIGGNTVDTGSYSIDGNLINMSLRERGTGFIDAPNGKLTVNDEFTLYGDTFQVIKIDESSCS